LLALDARFAVRSKTGSRVLEADSFFVSVFTTALEAGELIVEIEVPPLRPRTGFAFHERTAVRGDFALAGVAALVVLDEAGAVERAGIALLGAGDRPLRARAAERALVGVRVDDDVARAAAAAAVEGTEPVETSGASGAYRRTLLRELTRAALLDAAGRAG
jgi:carbon-monoxide dehydrogenase medium subunit